MRILFVTQFFDPEPFYKGLGFATELARRGHEVEVLTGFPNYPGGKVYPGYRIRPWRREKIGAVSIVRVALYPSHDRSFIGRSLNYATFAVSAAIMGAALVRRPDVILVYHPPVTTGCAALALQLLLRAPFVYDVQDLWPDTLAATGMVRSGFVMRAIGRLCRLIYSRATCIAVLSSGFRERLIARGVPPEKISVILNWAAEEGSARLVGELPEDEAKLLRGRFNVVFGGNMGPAQGLGTVLAAAAIAATRLPDVQFVLVGSGVDTEGLRRRAQKEGLSNVLFLPRRPPAAMPALFERANVLLVHLRDDPLFAITIPSKTQAYLMAGRPIILAVRGDAAELVRASGGGIACVPGDPHALVGVVAEFREMSDAERSTMGRSGQVFYKERLSLQHGVTQFLAVLHQASAERSPAVF
jgi:colanic acid biosynthesis glycosyl transferase WcaI